MSRRGTALLVFARAPRPGRTKTRLIPALGARGATRLHQRMVEHAVREATASGLGPVVLLGAPNCRHGFFVTLRDRHGCVLQSQSGGDLGARMHAALREALASSESAILIGSDCPLLGAADLLAANASLNAGADVVLAPAVDGGYVLIGMREAHAAAFADIAWGTGTVMAQTRVQLSAAGLEWRELPERSDVDEVGDLRHLPADWPEAAV